MFVANDALDHPSEIEVLISKRAPEGGGGLNSHILLIFLWQTFGF